MQMIFAANASVARGMPPTHTHSLLFGPGSTINPNALPYNDSPQSMALQEAPPFAPSWNEMTLSQTEDDSFEWLTGFEHQISYWSIDFEACRKLYCPRIIAFITSDTIVKSALYPGRTMSCSK
jgi:hypothetical protein